MVAIPLDGRLTSQNPLNIPLSGGELMWIVSPGNAQFGNTYSVQVSTLAAFAGVFPFLTTTVVTLGGTVGSPYLIEPTDTRILFNKTVASASHATAPASSTMIYPTPLLVKDIKGDAATNNITVSFTGGELCDGQATITVTNNYGWFQITPLPSGSGWYQSG